MTSSYPKGFGHLAVNASESSAELAAHPTLPGVDVSSFQGPPGGWVHEAGTFDWASVKITELEPNGTRYVNPDAAADWDWLKHNHKGRIGYLFGHPSVSVTATVDFFISELTALGLADDDGVALDLEVTDGLGAAAVSAWGVEVLSELHRRLGRKPLLYTFLSFAESGNCAGQGGYPLWIADPSSPPGHPRVPLPWHAWSIHQYDISGNIDRDTANYATLPEMFRALGKPPKEPDLTNLGGKLDAGLAVGRWSDGTCIVVGLGTDNYMHGKRFAGHWGSWVKVSPTTALGVPTIAVESGGRGWLYYINSAHEVIQLVTRDFGKTWS